MTEKIQNIKTTKATKAPPLLYRKLKFDLIPIFKGLTKGISHTLSQKFYEIPGDISEVLSGIGLSKSNEEIAFELIEKSIYSAAIDLTRESLSHFELLKSDSGISDKLQKTILNKITSVEISLQKDFFLYPDKLNILEDVNGVYFQWLIDMGVNKRSADSITKRFKSYFVYALSSEWKNNFNHYKQLIDCLDSPFGAAEERLLDWENYGAMLRRKINENVFEESFGLSQIYVPLNGYYIEKIDGEKKETIESKEDIKKYVVDLNEELLEWVKKREKSDPIRVLSGGPGSGKSSFTKMFCANLLNLQLAKPIYIPLHLIDPSREISEEIGRFVREEGYLRFNPLDPDTNEKELLIIFDGLDELACQGKASAQVAKDFVHAVERMVERRNLGENSILIIISGRELVIQENETEFRRKKEILNLLPYFSTNENKNSFIDKLGLLSLDYRDIWWKKYGELTDKNFTGLPINLKKHEIDDITSQPLLNYLVALSYTRGIIDFDKSINLNSVYADLVEAVYERGYEKNRIHKPISHITKRDFFRIMEEVGLAAWHGSDGRSTSVTEIMNHCKESGLDGLIKTFKEGAEAGVTKLLAAFFFRKNGQHSDGDATFVFTHKSFGEYLTAIRLVRGIDGIVKQLNRRKEDPDDGFDITEGLVRWIKLVGPAPITLYIRKFLIQEIEQKDKNETLLWQDSLSELLSHVIDKQMPMEKISTKNFAVASRQSNNASESLLIAVNACAIATEDCIKIKFSAPTSFGSFLKRICPQRPGPQSPIFYQSLSYFDFSNQSMDMADFYKANLKNTKWNNCKLNYAIFMNSNLSNSEIKDSALNNSNFRNANLENSKIINTDLHHAIMENSILINADFGNSDLVDATLGNSKFGNTNMDNVRITEIQAKHLNSNSSINLSTARIVYKTSTRSSKTTRKFKI